MSANYENTAVQLAKRNTFGRGVPIASTLTRYSDNFCCEIIHDGPSYYLNNKDECDKLVINGFRVVTTKDIESFISDTQGKFNSAHRIYANYYDDQLISLEFVERYLTLQGQVILYLSGCVLHPLFQGYGISCREPINDTQLFDSAFAVVTITQSPHMVKAFKRFAKNNSIVPFQSNYIDNSLARTSVMSVLANKLNLDANKISKVINHHGHLPRHYGKELGIQCHDLPDNLFTQLCPNLPFSRKRGDAYILCSLIGGEV